jgi:PHP family Zn ribbon phosphoesterase
VGYVKVYCSKCRGLFDFEEMKEVRRVWLCKFCIEAMKGEKGTDA